MRGHRRLICLLVAMAATGSLLAVAAPAEATPAVPAAPVAPAAPAAAPPPIPTLPPVDPGPDGTARITRVPSPATQAITPLPAVDPGPTESMSLARAPVVVVPPVEPGALTLPEVPAQTLIDEAEADALATLGAASPSFLDGGDPDLDPTKLQPQVASAQLLSTTPVPLQQTLDALRNLQIPPPLPIDPLAILQALPDGIPRITYRVCAESATMAVRCTISLPLVVPALVDVTGDGSVDVLADLLPAVSIDAIVAKVRELLDLQRLLNSAQNSLTAVLALLQKPLALLKNPGLLLQALNLQALVASLLDQIAALVDTILSLVNLGLAFLVVRTHRNGPLPAHIWAVYDVPGHNRLSMGYDGHRRGDTIPNNALGIFTFDPLAAIQGDYDVRGDVYLNGQGDSLAVTAGLARVGSDPGGTPFDPTVASAQFSPVPWHLGARAVVDLGEEEGTVETTSNRPSRLDVIVVTRRTGAGSPFGRFTQLVVDEMPTFMRASLTRSPDGEDNALSYRASSTVGLVDFSDFEYGGNQLDRALTASVEDLPPTVDASVNSSGAAGAVDLDFDYDASGRATALDLDVFDRAAAHLVGRARIRDIPRQLALLVDLPDDHVAFVGDTALGSAEAVFSRHLGSFAPLEDEHATLLTRGLGVGASTRVTGMRKADVFLGEQPRGEMEFDPGGQPFVAAADIQGLVESRIDVLDLPQSLSYSVDPAGKLSYGASAVVSAIRAAFIHNLDGPTFTATVFDLPQSLEATWTLDAQAHLDYVASSEIPRFEFFASPMPVETLQPLIHHYLSAAVVGGPTELELDVDFVARRIKWSSSNPTDGIDAVARFPFGGDVFTAAARLTDVPAQFDAEFADGLFRFSAVSGPVAEASLSVSNHAGFVAPVGQHLRVNFREVTGDFDASLFVRNLSHAEYSRPNGGQSFQLEADTAGEPFFLDVDVLLAENAVDDTRLYTVARVDGLPGTVTARVDGGAVSFGASSPGLAMRAEVRVGKVAALAGLGAPIFGHGVAAVARGCAEGPGCAEDITPFCTSFNDCFGVVATVDMAGLPTEVVVQLQDRTVTLAGWSPPAAVPFQAYLRLIGLVQNVPELEAIVTIDGLPSPLDITVGPLSLGGGGQVDIGYMASAPIGSLVAAVEAHDTPSLGTLRGTATASPLPSSMHVTASFGAETSVVIDNSAPVDTLTATVTGDAVNDGGVAVTLTGVPTDVDLVVDLTQRHIGYDASATLDSVEVLARMPFGGRLWGAYLLLAGVPTAWDADFGDGVVRFRTLSTALGAAQLAITNHAGATVPTGQHLAAHYRELTGDLDAGLRVTNLEHVEVVRTTSQSSFLLDSGGEGVTIDVDVTLEAGGFDDTKFAVVALLSTPNTMRVTLGDGRVTFKADTPVSLLASARIGKIAALTGLGAPLYANGVAVRARGCDPGPGCFTPDSTLVCELFDRCGGLVANVSLPGLPTDVVIDLEAQTVEINGYEPPPSPLRVFVQLDDLLNTIPHAAALVTLEGLPSTLDFVVGPFNFVDGDVTELEVGYEGSDAIGSMEVEAEADTTPSAGLGDLRGRAVVQPVPASVSLSGEFGSVSEIHYDADDPVNILAVQVTGLLQGNPASGRVEFTNVPAHIDLTMEGFAEESLGVPTITYAGRDDGGGGSSTLDGLVQVEADLIEAFSTGGVTIPVAGDAYARITDLGADTTVQINPDTSILFSSSPVTGQLSVPAVIESSVAAIPLNLQVFDEEGFVGTLVGHVGAPTLSMELELTVSQLVSLVLSPSQASYLTTGITGNYNSLTVDVSQLLIDPEVDLTLQVDGPSFFDFDIGPVVIDDPFTSARFHVSDQALRESGCVEVQFGPDIVHTRIFTKPGKIATGVDGITIFGVDGRQALNYIDPVPAPSGLDPTLVAIGLDLITAYVTDPFIDAEADYDTDFGAC